MTRRTMKPWLLAPALLLAGFVWIGVAHAQAPVPDSPEGGDIEMEFEFDGPEGAFDEGGPLLAQRDGAFDGPGGFSAPAPREREGRRMKGEAGERRHERMRGMGHGRMGGMHGKQGMRGRHGAMSEKLNLTDRQKEQMADVHEKAQRQMIPIRSGLAEARLDLRKLMRDESPNQAQIDAAIDRMAKLRADAQKAHVAARLEARSLLTPEQRKQMKGARGMMGHGMRGKMGGKMGGEEMQGGMRGHH
jgi:Spy/CpxP family protein refolding chaperone